MDDKGFYGLAGVLFGGVVLEILRRLFDWQKGKDERRRKEVEDSANYKTAQLANGASDKQRYWEEMLRMSTKAEAAEARAVQAELKCAILQIKYDSLEKDYAELLGRVRKDEHP